MIKIFKDDEIIKFIKWYMSKHKITIKKYFDSYQDCFQEIFMYIFKRLDKYNNKYSKATFLNLLCNNAIIYNKRSYLAFNRVLNSLAISINTPINEYGDELKDIISDNKDYFNEISNRYDVANISKYLNEYSKKYFFENKNIVQIGKEKKISKQRVQVYINKNLNEIKDKFVYGFNKAPVKLAPIWNNMTKEEHRYFEADIKTVASNLNKSTRTISRDREKILKKYNFGGNLCKN